MSPSPQSGSKCLLHLSQAANLQKHVAVIVKYLNSILVYTVYTVYSVYTVYVVYTVYNVYSVYSIYSVYTVYPVYSVYSVFSYTDCECHVTCSVSVTHFVCIADAPLIVRGADEDDGVGDGPPVSKSHC